MTQGVLIFAFNSEFNYQELALAAAKRVKEHLQLPVSLVTDATTLLPEIFTSVFDKIIFSQDTSTQTKTFFDGATASNVYVWKNANRYQSYDLTPYDETLVIDADYLVNGNFLLNCFKLEKDFLIYKNSYDLTGWREANEFKYVNQHSITFYWATVLYFKKTAKTRMLFDLVDFIRQNWNYYRLIYQIPEKKFRNDYAFSISLHILNGYVTDNVDTIPGRMYYVTDKDILIAATDNSCTLLVEKEHAMGEYTALKISDVDVHVMNKHSILRVLND